MVRKAAIDAPRFRELFIEELAEVQAGSAVNNVDGPYTTMACCEEGPFGCCDLLPIDPRP